MNYSDPNIKVMRRVLLIAVLIFLVGFGIFLALRSEKKSSQDKQILNHQQQALAVSPYANPILKYLPYGGIGYDINPTIKTISGKAILVLNVSVSFSGADYRASTDEQTALIKQREAQALDYIRSKGFDPAKYNIQYSIPASP